MTITEIVESDIYYPDDDIEIRDCQGTVLWEGVFSELPDTYNEFDVVDYYKTEDVYGYSWWLFWCKK